MYEGSPQHISEPVVDEKLKRRERAKKAKKPKPLKRAYRSKKPLSMKRAFAQKKPRKVKRMKNITLKEFVVSLRRDIGDFVKYWDHNAAKRPEEFPYAMQPGEWDEQFAAWQESKRRDD